MDDVAGVDLVAALTGVLSPDPQRKNLIAKLPPLTEEDLTQLGQKDSCCPICLTPFLAVLASEEMALAMDSPAVATEDIGVTRLADTCGHLFCRKDIAIWILQNDSCPTCRRPFITHPDPADFDHSNLNERELSYSNVGLSDMRIPEQFRSRPFVDVLLRAFEDTGSADDHDAAGDGPGGDSTNRDRHDDRDEFVGFYS